MSVWIPSVFASQRQLRGAAWEMLRVMRDTLPDTAMTADALATLAFEHGASGADEVRAVAAGLKRNESVADAMANAPSLYPPSVINAIRLGERTGCLRQAMEVQAEIYSPARSLVACKRSRWRLYIVVISVLFLIAGTFYSLFVLPIFREMFDEFGVESTDSFEMLLVANESGAIVLLVGILIALVVFSLLTLTTTFRDRLLPLLSSAERQRRLGESIRAISVPIELGRPASVAVGELATLEPSGSVRTRLRRAESLVSKGESLMHALHGAAMINDRELEALGASVDAQSLAWSMRQIADLRAWRGQRWVSRAGRLFGPIAVLTLAVLVGWCAYAIFGNLYMFVTELA